MAKLINGNGNPAIYAAEDADLIASLAGNVTCIANVGNKYAATEEDATTIRLDDGVIITKEGRRIQLEAGESDTFYIPTGTSGQSNYYIIGYKLVQNPDSTQVAEQFVQKMNSSSETITEDTFRSGATEVYVSVYRVTQVGFTIDSISGLLPELLDNASIKEDIDQINSDLGNKSSAGAVAGDNAFAKIATLNSERYESRDIRSRLNSGWTSAYLVAKIDKKNKICYVQGELVGTNATQSPCLIFSNDGLPVPAGSVLALLLRASDDTINCARVYAQSSSVFWLTVPNHNNKKYDVSGCYIYQDV